MRIADLVYDGTTLSWRGHGVFKASSGMPGHQNAAEQSHSDEAHGDSGPIPEGLYSLPLKVATDATMITPGQLDRREGVEHLPATWRFRGATYQNLAWGPDRVRLTILHIDDPKNRHRGGFYLHDSTKGYSHGCIEVSPLFFRQLRQCITTPHPAERSKTRLLLQVKYPSKTASTYGDTLVK